MPTHGGRNVYSVSADTIGLLRANLAAAQSTIALIQKIAGCQVDRLAEAVEGLVKERAAALERVGKLESEKDAALQFIGGEEPWRYWYRCFLDMREERDLFKREREEALEKIDGLLEAAKVAGSANYRQGFEDCREAAISHNDMETIGHHPASQVTKALDAATARIRALTVPERGEGHATEPV